MVLVGAGRRRWLTVRSIHAREQTLELLISPRRLVEITGFSALLVLIIIAALMTTYISRVGKTATTLKLW